MARNVVWKDADYLSLPVPTGTLSGAPVRVGELNGIAQTNEGSVDVAKANALAPNYSTGNGASSNNPGWASVALKGAARLAVDGAVTAVGQPIYWNEDEDGLTEDDTSGLVFGHALGTKAAGAGEIIVRIAN